ncbi:TraB/GumN family protein [Spirosoma areae]
MNNKRRLASRIALAGLVVAGSLTTTVQAQDKALLYEMTGPGITKPSYLYGTFHLVCPADLQITDAIKKAVSDAQQVYLEIDLDDPAMMGSMQKAMMMPDGKTVKDLLKPDDYSVLDNYLKQKMNMGLAQVGMLKPIGLMSMMYMTMLPCQPASYDMTFAQMAATDKKEVLGLETIEAELAALDKIPMEEQLKGLVDMAKKPDEAKKEFAEMVAIYKSHDLAKLMNTMKSSQFSGGDFTQFEESLLSERNVNWIPVIEKAAKEKPTFFAFGAGHLGNEKGVINLLRKKGYTVKPLQ